MIKNLNNKISMFQILSLITSRRTFIKPSRVYKKRYGITRGKQSLGIHTGLKSRYYFLGNSGARTFIPSLPTMERDKLLKIQVNNYNKKYLISNFNRGSI
tara:strand:+ start:662 stop:961 length:300 start_codon:yes stop_codon:yes gene_type:complete